MGDHSQDKNHSIQNLRAFLQRRRPERTGPYTAVSLFSGAGISDMGYELAGFRFIVQSEINSKRARLGNDNFPSSNWIVEDILQASDQIIKTYKEQTTDRLTLLTATPPCQGMSSLNPTRGKRKTPIARLQEGKNKLLLEIVPVAKALAPRIIIAENVRPMLTLHVTSGSGEVRLIDVLRNELPDYEVFEGIVDMADYGIPQIRKRAIVVAINKREKWLDQFTSKEKRPWPNPTHSQSPEDGKLGWITIREWFEFMQYPPLDSQTIDQAHNGHRLHFVPHYDNDRYLLINHIPPYSGRSGYQNDVCPECSFTPVPEDQALCPTCGAVMRNRPIVTDDGTTRLIKGFRSSYRRMDPSKPAYTITTNSSHIGSDYKIHPWENRVLSTLECSDLQTVPRFYDWSDAFNAGWPYLIRNVLGEALPSYFTYLHGQMLANLLSTSR